MSDPRTQALRHVAADLLRAGRVELVVGFERGTRPLASRPLLARRPQEAERLVCDAFAESNLARYLPGLGGRRVAIVARGCESRAIAALVAERQVERQELVVLGFPCLGVVDRRRLFAAAPGEVTAAEDEGAHVALCGPGWTVRLPRHDHLSPACGACADPNPALADLVIGEPVTPPRMVRDPMAEFEALPPAERWARFAATSGRCLRCYACRAACPLCSCPECFVDHSQPRWAPAGSAPAGIEFWQIMRAYHQAGRCVQCGACERACPVGIPLLYLTAKLNRLAAEGTRTTNGTSAHEWSQSERALATCAATGGPPQRS